MRTDKIIDDLQAPEEQVRKRALLQIDSVLDMRSLPILMKMAKTDNNLEIRFYAKKVLLNLRKKLVEEKKRRSSPAPNPIAGAPPPLRAKSESGNTHDLYAALNSVDPAQRIKAVMALSQCRDPRFLFELKRLDKHEESAEVRAAMVMAFGLIGGADEVGLVSAYLKDDDARVRINAVNALKQLEGVEAVADIASLLRDSDRRVKQLALDTLRGFPKRQLLEQLASMMSSAGKSDRDTGAYALLKLGYPETIPLLVTALCDKEISIRLKARNALVHLARQGNEQAFDALSRWAGERESPESFMTLSVLEKLPDMDMLLDARPRKRIQAVRAIVEDADRSRVPQVLQALLREKDEYVKASFIAALGGLGATETAPLIKRYAQDENPRIRANAVEALGKFGDQHRDFLGNFLDDENNRVRANAVVALGKSNPGLVLPTLKSMVTDRDPLMKRSAVFAMVELQDDRFLALLSGLTNDADPLVSKSAEEALEMLSSTA